MSNGQPSSLTLQRPQSYGLHVRIGTDIFRLVDLEDPKPLIQTAELQPPRVDTSANPEDIRPEVGVFFSLSDFSGGEGMTYYHRPEAAPNRFWDSRGVDVSPPRPGHPTTLSLLPNATSIESSLTGQRRLAYDGEAIYIASGNTVRRSANPLATTPTFANDDPHAGQGAVAVQHLTSLGSDVYAALGSSGIHRRTSGSWSHWSDLAATRVWGVKGRVIARVGAALHDAQAGTNSELLHTLDAGHTWTAVVDAGAFILATATDGVVYAFTLDEETVDITLASRSPIGGELVSLAFHSSGLVFLLEREDTTAGGSIVRFYRAGLVENGTLSFTTLLREWGDNNDTINRLISAGQSLGVHRDSVYVGVRDETGVGHLWRYDLETGGRARHISSTETAVIRDILVISNRLFFTAGTDLYRESADTFATSGYLISSLADHFTSADKNWSGININVKGLNGGFAEIWYSTDHNAIHDPDHHAWVLGKRMGADHDTYEVPINVSSRYMAVKLVLLAGLSNTASPHIDSFTIRAFPGTPDLILNLPINVSDQIEIPGLRRIKAHRLGNDNYNRLRGIEGSNKEVELFYPAETVFGVVEQVTTPVMALTSRGSRTLVSLVRVRGRRMGITQSTSSLDGMGIDAMGLNVLGGVS